MSSCHISTEVDYELWDQLCWLPIHYLPPAAVWLHWPSQPLQTPVPVPGSGQKQDSDGGCSQYCQGMAGVMGPLRTAVVLCLWTTPWGSRLGAPWHGAFGAVSQDGNFGCFKQPSSHRAWGWKGLNRNRTVFLKSQSCFISVPSCSPRRGGKRKEPVSWKIMVGHDLLS